MIRTNLKFRNYVDPLNQRLFSEILCGKGFKIEYWKISPRINQSTKVSYVQFSPSPKITRNPPSLKINSKERESLISFWSPKIAAFKCLFQVGAGAGGTRFGRFSMEGSLEICKKNWGYWSFRRDWPRRTDQLFSLHYSLGFPKDVACVRQQRLPKLEYGFDAMNSNTFQITGKPLSLQNGLAQ